MRFHLWALPKLNVEGSSPFARFAENSGESLGKPEDRWGFSFPPRSSPRVSLSRDAARLCPFPRSNCWQNSWGRFVHVVGAVSVVPVIASECRSRAMPGRRSIAATVSVSPDRIIGENGYVESLNGTLRDERLNGEIFYTVAEARMLIERWRERYNRVRPYSALGYRPPASEAIAAGPPSASLRAVQQRHSDRTTTASTVDSTAGKGHS